MLKYELRQRNFLMKDKEQNQIVVSMIWTFLTIFLMFATFYFVFKIVGTSVGEGIDPLTALAAEIGLLAYILLLIGTLLFYMVLKCVITIFCCHASAQTSIRLKVLEGSGMLVCFCREAFTFTQTMLIYFVPAAFVYGVLFYLCILSGAGAAYIMILIFMEFFMCYDLILVLYVLFFKIKDGADYISIDHHVYYMTLYRKPYVKPAKTKKLDAIKQMNR